ncbi:Regulator of nonsense transcripts upf2 [Cichlidogyrus casuarinus]|uniref:Regulator of nonsense transcripts upf2 n=1 Tax=Cichlidogyrus casuarinus TaxID=1844966 RepID=A0ABD2QJ83_9PLAT
MDDETFKKMLDAEESSLQNLVIETANIDLNEDPGTGDTELDLNEVLNTDPSITSNFKEELTKFLNTLPQCVNRDLIDKAALDFCISFNKKSCHRALVQKIFSCPRNRLDLIPFYSRLVANLNPIMPWVTEELNQLLVHDFYSSFKPKRLAFYIESKLKNARFIGEMVKFGLIPPKTVFSCIRRLLEHFTGHSIDVVCCILETCGRFLARSRGTARRTKILLEILVRKKRASRLDPRYEQMIDSAYVYCNPQTNVRRMIPEVIPPLELFLRRILWKDLTKESLTTTLRVVRKLNWKDRATLDLGIKMFTEAWQLAFHKIEFLASILSGLATYHFDLAVGVVDCVLEEIQIMLEINDPKYNQRRISMMKYLGLLYNYRLVDAGIIFKILYLLINFGTSYDLFAPHQFDPPTNLFRIQLVCTLLDTCGYYFETGSKRKKLAIFLLYFQRYYWFKRSLPVFVQYPSESEDTNLFGATDTTEEQDKSIKWTPYALQQFLMAQNPKLRPQNFPFSIQYIYDEYIQSQRSGVVKTKSLDQCERLMEKLEAQSNKAKRSLAANNLPGEKKALDSISEEADLNEEVDEDLDIIQDEHDSEISRPAVMVLPEEDNEQYEDEMNGQEDSDSEDNSSDDSSTVVDSGSELDYNMDAKPEANSKPNYIECEEDLEFQRMFDQVTSDARFSSNTTKSVLMANQPIIKNKPAANSSTTTTTYLNTASGLGTNKASATLGELPSLEVVRTKYLAKGFTKTANCNTDFLRSLTNSQELAQANGTSEPLEEASIKFTLLTRKKNNPAKLSAVPLHVPESVDFAAKFLSASKKEAEDKRLLKESVLRMHQEQKEQDLISDLEQINQQIFASNQPRCQPPRGVPDTSAIFGNQGMR